MRTTTITLIAVVVLCSLVVPCAADMTYWQGSSGFWTDGGHWTEGVPEAGDYAYITNGSTATVDAAATAQYLRLGKEAGESGTVRIDPTGALSLSHNSSYILLGMDGTGEIIQTGGSVAMTGSYAAVAVGYEASGRGSYELGGTGTLSTSRLLIGYWGTGTFTQTGGTNTLSSDVRMGHGPGSVGRYELSGTGELRVRDELYVGDEGKGTFVQTGGSVEMTAGSNYVTVGYNASSWGAYELGGTGALSCYRLTVGLNGTGAFTQTGDTVALGSDLRVDYGSTSRGTYEMTGGQLDVSDSITIGNEGVFTLDGGTVSADGVNVASGGKFRWFSGRLELPDLTVGPGRPLGANLLLDSGKALGVPSPIVVETGGSLILSGGSYECDSTQLAGGVLTATQGMTLTAGQQITGEGTIYGAVDLTDAAIDGSGAGLTLYGDLSGTGTVSDCTIYGEVSVGHSPGRMTMQDVIFGGGTRLNMEIGGLGAGDFDEIVFVGDAALSGHLRVLLTGEFSPALGDRFDLFNWTDFSGGFGPIDLPRLPGGLEWSTADLYVTGELAVLPEPATLTLLTLGGLALVRRRKLRVCK